MNELFRMSDARGIKEVDMEYMPSIRFCGLIAIMGCALSAPVVASDLQTFLEQAESACFGIENDQYRELSFKRLHAIVLELDEIEKAEKLLTPIRDSHRRFEAHIAVAEHYAEKGDLERCKAELYRATPFATESQARSSRLVDAYLELAESPELAISFMTDDPDDAEAREELCRSLARHGYMTEALKIIESQIDIEERSSWRLTAALAAAKAARISDMERAMEGLKVSHLARQNVWGELASALYQKGNLQLAQMYAGLVDNGRIKRKIDAARRTIDPQIQDVLRFQVYDQKGLPGISLRSDDPEAANQVLEQIIVQAEKNPVKATTGQFGPWNQEFQLARIRAQYVLVAELFRQAGDQARAEAKMKNAEEAILLLLQKEKGFGAFLALSDFQRTLIYFKNVKELRRLAETSKMPLYRWAADAVVRDMVLSGEFEAAKELAMKTLSRDNAATFFDRTTGDRSEMVSCFVEAGKLELAREILKSSKPGLFAANACENAGRAIAKKDCELLVQPEWQNDLGAFQRAHLCMGAALAIQQMNDVK